MSKFVTTDAVEFVRDFIRAALPLLEPEDSRFEARWRRLSVTTLGSKADSSEEENSDIKRLSFTVVIHPYVILVGNGWIDKGDTPDWVEASLVFQYKQEIAWRATGHLSNPDTNNFTFAETRVLTTDIH